MNAGNLKKDEIILVDSSDRALGFGEKIATHKAKARHRAFSVLIFNSFGEMLLQKRHKGKYHAGGLWSNACCGHPTRGRIKTKEAAQLRLREEMGFTVDLEEMFAFKYQIELGDLWENEYDHVFVGLYNGTPKPDLMETEDCRWISLADLTDDIRWHPSKYTYWFRVIINDHLPQIKAHLLKNNPFLKILNRSYPDVHGSDKVAYFFLPSRGCTKALKSGPCKMCVFCKPHEILGTPARKPTDAEILSVYTTYAKPSIEKNKASVLAFLIGGSILDKDEFPQNALYKIIEDMLPKTVQKVIIESRPEYITSSTLKKLKEAVPKKIKLTIYFGVESGSESIRNKYLNKQISDQSLRASLQKLKKFGFSAGAYLLAGIPGLYKGESINDAINSVKWCVNFGFFEILLSPTVVPQSTSYTKKLYEAGRFSPLNLREFIAILEKVSNYPVLVGDLDEDPPYIAGCEGSRKEKNILSKFNLRFSGSKKKAGTKLDDLALYAHNLPINFPSRDDLEIFSHGNLIILGKILGTLFGDTWACLETYGAPYEDYQKKAIPFLTQIQLLIYMGDVAVEHCESEEEVMSILNDTYNTIYSELARKKLVRPCFKKLFEEVYQFELSDRMVRQKKPIFTKNQILKILHYKVSDLLALMRMAADLCSTRVPASDWKIWRQFEFVREFMDDAEDKEEDIKDDAEQYNSIAQMEKRSIDVKKVVTEECLKLVKMIDAVADTKRKKQMRQIYIERVKKEIPKYFPFKV
jgi:isopentenyl-diphosphate delta-isomerase